jgi:aldehyde dehydrogenase (NAD+)
MATTTKDYGIMTGGEEHAAASGETFEVLNPATGEVLAKVAQGGPDDVARAVEAAQAAFPEWRATSEGKRSRLLLKLADAIQEHAGVLAELETKDVGKPITVSEKVDLRSAPEAVQYFAGMLAKGEGRTIPVPGKFLNYTVREPWGVVAGIIPWNYPLLQAIWKIAPAVMAGNTVVLKPAEQAPLSPLELVRLCQQVGFPEGVVNAVPGDGSTGEALCKDPRVKLIAFTGSNETGKLIQHYAADRVVPVMLELGGKSPNVVFEDADLRGAIAMAHASITTNQGEVCTAGSRLLVHESIHDEVVQGVIERMQQKTVIGDPMDADTTMGPLIDAGQFERVQGFVDRAKTDGGELVLGGGRHDVDGLDSELFFQPTVFDNVDNKSEIAQSEVFGPVLCVMSFSDEDEAIALANDVEHGLAASIFTTNVGRAHRVAGQLEAGNVWINTWGNVYSASPYGGYKRSGHGREMGFAVMEALTQEKSVWVSMR